MLETRELPPGIEMQTVPCDLCGSDDLSVWDRARANTLTICNVCGLVFTNPRIAHSKDKDEHIYTASYFQQKSRMTEKLQEARRISYRNEIGVLEQIVSGGKILDVGCGMGLFLDCFGPGWERHGCDVSSYGLEEARKRGVTTYHGEFEKMGLPAAAFDVVYFRASLHHVYAPRHCFEKAMHVLRPGGVIVVAMSNNRDGLCGRLFRGHVRSYEQAHNFLFSTDNLMRYMRQSGIEPVRASYPYFGTGYGNPVDFVSLPLTYARFLWLNKTGCIGKPSYHDFASPAFPGNYVSVYGRRPL